MKPAAELEANARQEPSVPDDSSSNYGGGIASISISDLTAGVGLVCCGVTGLIVVPISAHLGWTGSRWPYPLKPFYWAVTAYLFVKMGIACIHRSPEVQSQHRNGAIAVIAHVLGLGAAAISLLALP